MKRVNGFHKEFPPGSNTQLMMDQAALDVDDFYREHPHYNKPFQFEFRYRFEANQNGSGSYTFDILDRTKVDFTAPHYILMGIVIMIIAISAFFK